MAEHLKFAMPKPMALSEQLARITHHYYYEDIMENHEDDNRSIGIFGWLAVLTFMGFCLSVAWIVGTI